MAGLKSSDQWVNVVFFDEAHTDFVVRGPFPDEVTAARDADGVWDNYKPGGIDYIGTKLLVDTGQ